MAAASRPLFSRKIHSTLHPISFFTSPAGAASSLCSSSSSRHLSFQLLLVRRSNLSLGAIFRCCFYSIGAAPMTRRSPKRSCATSPSPPLLKLALTSFPFYGFQHEECWVHCRVVSLCLCYLGNDGFTIDCTFHVVGGCEVLRVERRRKHSRFSLLPWP